MSATQIWERLFVGGIRDADFLPESNPPGITTVIALCRETVRKHAHGVNYRHLPVRTASPIQAARFDEIVDALWENIRWGTVLLHSLAGVNRAPILAAAWLSVVGCKNIDAALADIGRLRTIEPDPVLLRSVKELL